MNVAFETPSEQLGTANVALALVELEQLRRQENIQIELPSPEKWDCKIETVASKSFIVCDTDVLTFDPNFLSMNIKRDSGANISVIKTQTPRNVHVQVRFPLNSLYHQKLVQQAMIAEQTNPLSQLEQIKAERTALDAREAQLLATIGNIGHSIVQKMVQTMHPNLVFAATPKHIKVSEEKGITIEFNSIEVPNEFPDIIKNDSLSLDVFTCHRRPSATTKNIIGFAHIPFAVFRALSSKQTAPVAADQN